MDCNQQRRPQNGCGRPMMNNGRSSMPGYAMQGSMNNSRNNSMSGSMNNSRNHSAQNSRSGRGAMNNEDCGCGGNTRSNTAEMDSFAVGMAYVPWQRWNQTYDMHRGLSSGTIFPELDKPFCAAGRCGR